MEDVDDDILDNEMHAAETGSTTSEVSSETASTHPKRKRKNSEGNRWMETAANALTQLTNQEDDEQDEWDIFGKDVANSLRGLKNPDWQRRAKFAVQTAIFQATEKARHPVSVSQAPIVSTAQFIDPFFSSLGTL